MKRLGVLAAVAIVVAAVAAPATGAIVLFFDRATARPGDHVPVYTGVAPGKPNGLFSRAGPAAVGVRVYLVPLARAGVGLWQRSQPGWVRIGELRRDPRGVGRLTLVVPRVPPGLYTTAVWCRPCRRPGGSFFVSGALLGPPVSRRSSILRVAPR